MWDTSDYIIGGFAVLLIISIISDALRIYWGSKDKK